MAFGEANGARMRGGCPMSRGEMMERQIQQIELPNGETVLARVSVMRPEDVPHGHEEPLYEDVGALDHLTARVDQLNELVSGIGSAVLDAARAARPDEVSATFGIELVVKPGKAVALLADGEAKAAVSVTLTWRRREAQDTVGPPDASG